MASLWRPDRHFLPDGAQAWLVKRILILGGYGNFGSYIARSLASEPDIQLIIAGRSEAQGREFANTLPAANWPQCIAIDIRQPFEEQLTGASPDVVIHTIGPFQGQDYRVAEACIRHGAHYVDLADARAFVGGIDALDNAARSSGVLVVSGASSVPCLTAALVDEALVRFSVLHELDYGISAAQQTNRGLGTASSVLSYVGRPFRALRSGRWRTVYGWQNFHAERYPGLGLRLFADCDIPDLDLFPKRYPQLRTVRFCAGHEIKLLHIGTWLLSWLVRLRMLPPLDRFAERPLNLSFLFDPLGSDESGFHMYLKGIGKDGCAREEAVFIIARSGHGPLIPCMPAIILAKRIAEGSLLERGARPCLDLIPLDEYLKALRGFQIEVIRSQ
jgi:saccharopine dehydrogenase-like NADP-dependent oxidoreductase